MTQPTPPDENADNPDDLYTAALEATGYPPPWHEPPTAAEWYEPEGTEP